MTFWHHYAPPEPGMTLDGGRIVVDGHLRGRLWNGHLVGEPSRSIVIAYKYFPYASAREQLDELLRYDVPGISPLAFLGYPDKGPSPQTARELAELHRENVWPAAALAEVRPVGATLSETEPLTTREVILLGVALCDTILEWAARRPFLSVGLRPETVYVTGPIGQRVYSGATPRVAFLVGDSPEEATFSYDMYEPPAASRQEITVDDAGFIVACILWFALLHENPYKVPGAPEESNVWNDRRLPFTGPSDLGHVLEAVLVADAQKRMKASRFREELLRLADVYR